MSMANGNFFRILDICKVNSNILLRSFDKTPRIADKSMFTKQVAKELAVDYLEVQLYNMPLTRELKLTISRMLGDPCKSIQSTAPDVLQKQKNLLPLPK